MGKNKKAHKNGKLDINRKLGKLIKNFNDLPTTYTKNDGRKF